MYVLAFCYIHIYLFKSISICLFMDIHAHILVTSSPTSSTMQELDVTIGAPIMFDLLGGGSEREQL